jgi:hypothetical protein
MQVAEVVVAVVAVVVVVDDEDGMAAVGGGRSMAVALPRYHKYLQYTLSSKYINVETHVQKN